MPTRRPRQAKLARSPKVDVTLTKKERSKVSRDLLEIASPAKRAAVTRDLERVLSIWASQLANVPNVSLRSDLVSRADPLASRVETLYAVLKREDDLVQLAAYKGFVDPRVLSTLGGFAQLAAWLKAETSKRGGERRAFRKQVNDEWKSQTRAWFDRHAPTMPAAEKARRRSAFLRLVMAAVERALS